MIAALLLASTPAAAGSLDISTAVKNQCKSRNPNEIVVCGSRENDRRYRLPELPKNYDRAGFSGSTQLRPGLAGAVHVDPVELPGGAKSNRVMITLSTKF